MFIDSHCHLQLFALHEDLDKIIFEAAKTQVIKLLCVATNIDQYPVLEKIQQKYQQLVDISLGIHPCEKISQQISYEELLSIYARPNVIAIGEIGLDYYHNVVDQKEQQARFRKQLEIAITLNKPVIMHTRCASADTLNILSDYPALRGVAHCFTETIEFAHKILDLGWYISFSGIITFNNAHDLREIVRLVPLDRLLVETDSPYLAPMPFRGKTNYPKYIRIITERVAKIHNINLDEMNKNININYNKLFSKPIIKA